MTVTHQDLISLSPRLSDLDDTARYERFTALQSLMPAVWADMRLGHDDESVVVVPSVSADSAVRHSGVVMQAMEERALFLLLLLRQPRLRMVYVTSMPVSEEVIGYYLALLPGVIPTHARRRLSLVSVGDSSSRPLSRKLLDRPRMLTRIAELVPNKKRSHLIPYNTTDLERDVAVSLGIPMYGADPRLAELGSKTGCRRLFAEVGVPHPLGEEDLHSLDDVTDALVRMRAARPSMEAAIVKLNEGASGSGNALVDLRSLPAPGRSGERAAVAERVSDLQLESTKVSYDTYVAALGPLGGIVEERLLGAELRSPSVQFRALPDGSVELLSTHDQLLGGASGQSYLGCVFPADPAYAQTIAVTATPIAERLAQLGVLGRFAVDFVVVRDSAGGWSSYAIELNLRKGGTTHPFLTLQYLTDGSYDGTAGQFITAAGQPRHLVATDHLEAEELKGLLVEDLFDIVATTGLHFDQATQTGVVFHMMSCLTECGRVGMTAVGGSRDEAWDLYHRAEEAVLAAGRAALRESAVPG
jgi:PGM1 C-terminal domain